MNWYTTKWFIILTLSLTFINNNLVAQSANTPDNIEYHTSNYTSTDTEILFSSDNNQNKYFVDLELIKGGLSDICVMDKEGNILINNSLMNTPHNAFYELDLSDIEKGNYIIRIRSFKEEIKKEVTVI